MPGTPAGKTLQDLINACRPQIRSHQVNEALRDIQRLRNRSAHDGIVVADEDALLAVRRLLDVLAWYASAGSGALDGYPLRLAPEIAAKAEFAAGLYITLDFRLVRRFELSRHSVYQLFVRERGLRTEHAELLLSKDAGEAADALRASGGRLLQTSLPKLSRFVILEHDGDVPLPEPLGTGCRVIAYDRFMDAFVDVDRHLSDVAGSYPDLGTAEIPVTGDLLTCDERSGQMQISRAGDAAGLLEQIAAGGGNLLLVGRAGSGKTTLLKHLVAGTPSAATRRHRFFFDLSIKGRSEPFAEFVTRTLAPYMSVEAAYVFPVLCYFARAGSVMCALDGIDEAVPETTLAGFLSLFGDLAQVLSAESAVVATSRTSFLEDSPDVRRLLDGTNLMSEKLARQLHAEGVDPLRLPRFSVLLLRDDWVTPLPLQAQLARETGEANGQDTPAAGDQPSGPDRRSGSYNQGPGADLASLLWRRLQTVAGPEWLPQLVAFFGLAFLRGVTTFTLAELASELGIDVFGGARISFEAFTLAPLFRPAGLADPAGAAGSGPVTFLHSVYQELLAAEFLRTTQGREAALAVAERPHLTEQVCQFLSRRSSQAYTNDCVVPADVYLVGPGYHLMLRRITRPVRFDRFPVTVERYKRFLDAISRHEPGRWEHPDTPPGWTHLPLRERLRVADYYDNPAYDNHPAIAVGWWSAYAFARFEGKRLPTSLEWEAAARGTDGRLFPWGDDVDISAVNCADSWSGRPLITYDAWRAELDQGRLGRALPTPVAAHPANRSPFGICEMSGNVWHWTATALEDLNEAVICGGAFNNPYRAVQASSKGTFRREGRSSAVGFRCVEDLP